MENISPTLLLLMEVRAALECGTSVRTGIKQFLSSNETSINDLVAKWILYIDQNQDTTQLLRSSSSCRRTLFTILEKGLNGVPILPFLVELEIEVLKSCESELQDRVNKLPFKLMLPVFFLMFPAYLILLLGPFIETLLSNL